MQEEVAGGPPFGRPAAETLAAAAPSPRQPADSMVAAGSFMGHARIPVAGDTTAQDLDAESMRLTDILRRSAIQEDSMTSMATGRSIPVALFLTAIESCI